MAVTKIQETKNCCLNRWGECDESMQLFSDNVEIWYEGIDSDVQSLMIAFLEQFSYYSHKKVNSYLQPLHEQLRLSHPEVDNALFTYIKEPEGSINSSVDYWSEYAIVNNIPMCNRTDDLSFFTAKSCWENISTIVLIDDCCGSGQTVCDFLKKYQSELQGKTLCYVVLHIMKDAVRRIEEEFSKAKVNLKYICVNEQDKYFKEDDNDLKKRFIQVSKELGVPEKQVLGYGCCESLMAFYNNCPNNTFGIIWSNRMSIPAIFPRIPKKRHLPWLDNEQAKKEKRDARNYGAKKRKNTHA